MTHAAEAQWSEGAIAVCLFLTMLVPLACAGLALINTGLGRSRSAAHAMLAALCALGVAWTAYLACGFAVQGVPGGAAHIVNAAGKPWDWAGAGPLFLYGVGPEDSHTLLAALFGMFAAGLAAQIPLGAGGDRWRMGAIWRSTALAAAFTYPLFAHWTWGGGWLAQLGRNFGIGRGFLDAGGAAPVQVAGGLTALSIAWILGPRRGKYNLDGMPLAIPGHNAVLILFGCVLALVGWFGLNGAGAMLFAGGGPGLTALIAMNTALSAGGAALAAAAVTRARFGKPDASLAANGWVAGLVASSAGCAVFRPPVALIVGVVAGVLAPFAVEWFELRFGIDDPGGAISVHAVAGMWGILAAGLFAPMARPARPEDALQWLAQLAGIAALIGFVLPLTYGLNRLLDRFYTQRIAPDGERHGMDLHELGAGAYPDFLTHTDEFTLR